MFTAHKALFKPNFAGITWNRLSELVVQEIVKALVGSLVDPKPVFSPVKP